MGEAAAPSLENAGDAEARLASVLGASSDAIYTEDRDGVILSWNRGAERLYGYSSDEAVGRRSDMLFPLHLRAEAREALDRVLAGETIEQIETEARRQDGMLVPVSYSLFPIQELESLVQGATAVARDITEQKLALATLAESEAKLQEAQALAHVGIWTWDSMASTVQWSDELYRIHGVDPMDFDGTYEAYVTFVAPEDRKAVGQALQGAVSRGETLEIEYQIVRPTGERRWVYTRADPVSAFGFSTPGLRGICQDVTERRHAEEVLRRQADLLGLLQRIAAAANEAQTFEEALRACLHEVCAHGRWSQARALFVSPGGDALENELRFSGTGAGGVGFSLSAGAAAKGIAAQVLQSGEAVWVGAELAGTTFSFPVLVGRETVAVLEFLSPDPRPRDGQLMEAMAVATPQLGRVLERMRAKDALSHQALHDPLTNLPNRTLFLDRLGHALTLLRREGGLLAVLFLDLDGFKLINDSLGHEAGDELLARLADRLHSGLRQSDTVARFGGDEFTVLCENVRHEEEVLAVARRVADVVAMPVVLGASHEVALTASVGIAFSRGEGTPEGLLRDADVAMYRAKEQGPARCEIFDVALHARATHRLETTRALRRAVDQDELRLFYQPQVVLTDGRIVGVEALVRWQHPERGLLGPLEFIPLAEESQLVVTIGGWVLAEACRQAARWREQFSAPLKISVNVSARQLTYGDLADDIQRALNATGTDPASLCLEITESVLMADAEFYLEALLGLKFLGVSLAVDDFGTGYSSLGYLKRFPIDILKLDKTFVDGLGGQDGRSRAIPRAVISLARDLGMTPLAEGVESPEQAAELVRLGCGLAQGYLFARPQPADAVSELLRAGVIRTGAADPAGGPPSS